jgi:signal transduction histidine kinase
VKPRPSLGRELLINLWVLAAAALAIAVASVVLVYGLFEPAKAAIYVGVLVALDMSVLILFVAYQVDKVVLRPLREAMASAELIASGDLARRLPEGDTLEMANLAVSVNRMTDRLLEERAHLVRAEKMASIGRLAAGVAHEIGNPLAAINGYVHMLATASAGSESSNEAIAGLERETARIDRIVHGLLDYARAKPRASGDVNLAVIARSVVDLLKDQGVLKNVTVNLKAASDDLPVAGDRHDLEQAFLNLLLNAVDAMEGSGLILINLRKTTKAELLSGTRRASDNPSTPPRLPDARAKRWLDATKAESLVAVVITDSGPGIPEEETERIFDPFYTTKEPGKGTGLGLAIVARAVENAGGTIWASRSREGGAAFRMLFPS